MRHGSEITQRVGHDAIQYPYCGKEIACTAFPLGRLAGPSRPTLEVSIAWLPFPVKISASSAPNPAVIAPILAILDRTDMGSQFGPPTPYLISEIRLFNNPAIRGGPSSGAAMQKCGRSGGHRLLSYENGVLVISDRSSAEAKLQKIDAQVLPLLQNINLSAERWIP